MIPYIAILFFIFFNRFLINGNYIENSKKAKKTYLISTLFPIFFMLAFRDVSIGADTMSYINGFEEQKLLSEAYDERLEIGYIFYLKFLVYYFSSSQILLISSSFFICLSIGVFIYRTAKDPSLALLFFITLGFFQFSLSGIRQSLAISITLWLYPYIRDRKIFKFFVGIILAALFHKSALFFVPAYFVAQLNISRKVIVIETISFLLFFLFADKLLLFAADTMDYNYGIEETGNGYIFFSIVCIITILGYRNSNCIILNNKWNKNILNINYISLVLWLLRLVSRTVERVSLFYMPYTYLLLEEYVSSKRKNKSIVYFIVSLLAMCLFLYRTFRDPSIYPYVFSFL